MAHAKKPSDIETNISFVNSEICIYILGFGILWSGLSVKSFLALVPVQNGGGRSSSKNSLCQKTGVVTTPIFYIGFGSIGDWACRSVGRLVSRSTGQSVGRSIGRSAGWLAG